jgi:hypothetical protein
VKAGSFRSGGSAVFDGERKTIAIAGATQVEIAVSPSV